MVDVTKSPYYDDYNPDKNFTKILAVPGRPLQARELTQIGDIAEDFTQRLGSAVFQEGAIISGIVPTIKDGVFTTSSGKIFLNGLVRNVDSFSIPITQVGNELIGAKVISEIITEAQDLSLRDPAQASLNFGNPGAHRIKETVRLVLNDESSVTIFQLKDGEILNTAEESDVWQINEMLARRTYDESGNYKVRGLNLYQRNEIRIDPNTNETYIVVGLTAGKAYIKGFEVEKQYNTTVLSRKSTTTHSVSAEPKTYLSGINTYKLIMQPAKTITKVVAQVYVHDNSMIKGNQVDGEDRLKKTPVDRVISVKQGVTQYTPGTDYILTNNSIKWTLTGNKPEAGTTYAVEYVYRKTMEDGIDYTLNTNSSGESVIQFLGADVPIDNAQFEIDYDYYLARTDLVVMDTDGNTSVIEGMPATLEYVTVPRNQNPNLFDIGTITVKPNSNEVILNDYPTTRLTQSQLYDIYTRLNDVQYNTAITDLDVEAESLAPATSLKGVFTDGFIGVTKADPNHPDYNCTIDLDMEEMTLPMDIIEANVMPNFNHTETRLGQFGHVITAPYEHVLAISQLHATGSMLVNEYAVYDALCPVTLNPQVDNWVEKDYIVTQKTVTKARYFRRWWGHWGEAAAMRDYYDYQELSKTNFTTTQVTEKVVLDEAIMYMRRIEVQVKGLNFYPGDNVTGYFNEVAIPLTATGDTIATGTQLVVKADGSFTGKFTVPSNVQCGTVPVHMLGEHRGGQTTYSAQGRHQIIQRNVLITKTAVGWFDPLAQTFGFEEDCILSKAKLYFATKSTDDTALIIQIRDVVNGYPGQTVYAEQVVEASDVNVSNDASADTEVQFNQPVYCQKDTSYALCVLTESNEYSMWIAELGKIDVQSHEIVTSQPYTKGVLFTSSNAQTWTAHQRADLKFQLYKCKYLGEAVIIFEDVDYESVNRLLIAADSLDYQNHGVEWYYKTREDSDWSFLETYVDRDLDHVTTRVSIKCIMHISESTSPIIPSNCLNLIGFTDETVATYISRTVEMSSPYKQVQITLDLCLPDGQCSYDIYAAGDDETFHPVTVTPTTEILSSEFTRYTWKFTELNGQALNDRKYKVKVVLRTSNPLIRPRARKLINIFLNDTL